MCENLLCQPAPLTLVERLVKAEDTAASLEAVPRHLQLVHGVYILYVHLDTRSIWCLRGPEVEIFVSPSFKV